MVGIKVCEIASTTTVPAGGCRPYIVGIGGTTKPGSSTEQALDIALRAVSENGIPICERLLHTDIFPQNASRRSCCDIRLGSSPVGCVTETTSTPCLVSLHWRVISTDA